MFLRSLRALAILTPIVAYPAAIGAQNPTPSTTPADDVVRISTNLVQLDVTVTNADGRPVADLRPDEIELYQNGKKQKLTHFSFIAGGKAAPPGPTSAKDQKILLPPPPITPTAVKRTIALVADDLALSWESVYYTRRAMNKFVDEQMQDGDLVAVLRTGGGIGILQQFTNDKRLLHAAIDKIKYNLMGRGGITGTASIDPLASQTLSGVGTGDLDVEYDNFLTAARDARAAIFSSGTLGALQYIVRGMQPMPGRKSAILFSDGFRLFERDKDGTPHVGLVMQYVRKVIEDANRAAVVFYTIDPRGLQTSSMTASDSTHQMSPEPIRAALDAGRREVWDSQNGLAMLAQETGGFAFFNNNDLSSGVAKILNDQSYYLVAFVPDSDTFDSTTKYNKIDVKILRRGLSARYRSGFFGVTDTAKIAAPMNKDVTFAQQLRDAIYSPFSVSGITLRLNSLFGSNPDNTPYVRSLLHIEARDLKFTDEKDGQKSCAFDVAATSFGDNGQLVDQVGKRYSMTITPEVYAKVLEEGFVYHFKFPVTKPGAYQYRVALRDSVGGNIGAASQFVQVPDLGKGSLALSSIALENMSIADYQASPAATTDVMTDSAIRRIKVGRVYRYSLEIYNASLGEAKRPSLQSRIRVFREGKLILDGQPKAFDVSGQADLAHLRLFGGLAIGTQMEPGEYVLQVIVTDNNKRNQVASQFVQFEVVQ